MLTNDQEQLLVSRERELHELKRQLSKMMDHVTETSLHPHSRAFTQYLKVESIGTMKEAIDDGVNVMKCMGKNLPAGFIPGGGAADIEIARRLIDIGSKSTGLDQYAIKKFGEALEVSL